jgi:hypothetical protein
MMIIVIIFISMLMIYGMLYAFHRMVNRLVRELKRNINPTTESISVDMIRQAINNIFGDVWV